MKRYYSNAALLTNRREKAYAPGLDRENVWREPETLLGIEGTAVGEEERAEAVQNSDASRVPRGERNTFHFNTTIEAGSTFKA